MKTIAYYISDYGFGHATRSIAVIRALLRKKQTQYRIIICCSTKIMSFIRASLHSYQVNVHYHQCASDMGYILRPGTIKPDLHAFRMKYREYIEQLPIESRIEKDFLLTNKVDLVISDIYPTAILAAEQAKVISVGLSNFTWFTAYSQMIERQDLQPLYEAYAAMDYFIRLVGANEPVWERIASYRVGFYCREVNWKEVFRIQQMINPGNKKNVIYFGIGMSIDDLNFKQMKIWDDDSYLFIVSSNMNLSGRNIVSIPALYTESQHYVAASDLVISKPGWSTVSEAIILQKPLILLHRSTMNEDKNTIRAVQHFHPCHLMEWEQLIVCNLRDFTDTKNSFAINQYKEEVEHIVSYLENIIGN